MANEAVTNAIATELDCAQRAQTSTKASNLNQVIRCRNPGFGLIRILGLDVCRIAPKMF